MRVEIRLKRFLKEQGLDYHGVIKEMAKDLKVHRHTIGRVYNNDAETVGLPLLGDICDWIIARNPGLRGALPRDLIGPAELLPAIKGADLVHFYLGEYREVASGGREYAWVARDDAEVASRIAGQISSGRGGPEFRMEFVSFDVVTNWRSEEMRRTRRETQDQDFVELSDVLFREIRKDSKRCVILIGSQRVNLLVERFVADCFGCEPFKAQRRKGVVPFYLAYRQGERARKSCFGGTEPPPGQRGKVTPGIHYLNENKQWVAVPWEKGAASAGIVFAQRDPAQGWLEMALFGFSGKATLELGRAFVDRSSDFWPLFCRHQGREVGVFLFGLRYSANDPPHIDVIKLDEKVLKGCLDGG